MEYTIEKMTKNELAHKLPQLLEIPQPPQQMYIVGKLPDAHIYVSVVGSRRYSDYGQQCCRDLILGLRSKPVAIVSGLAYGIDEIAHHAAMSAKLPTVAIPGSGLDPSALYPRGHTQLAEEILYNGGCLLSELQPYEKAAPWTFPQRNRIMAGIARAVLIIEAEEKSGTLITARLATEYNRDVLAVPGSIFSATSAGTNFLLRQGATPITCANDLLQALGLLEENKMFPFCKDNKNETKNAGRTNSATTLINRPGISPEEQEVLNLLLISPVSRDEISIHINRKIHEISATISILEIKGLIEEKFGRLWLKH
jgi:DNA processing protein